MHLASRRVRCSKTPARCDLSRSRVEGRDLPCQVVISGPGCELVEAHRHTTQKGVHGPGAVRPTRATSPTETTCTRCDEPISAGEAVIWMPGINARGAAHPRCTFLTDPGRRRGPATGRTATGS